MNNIRNIFILILSGILLIPVLLLSLINKEYRVYWWNWFNNKTYTYAVIPLDKINQLFSLCVNYLILVGNKINMTYNEINIWIFCIIWPIITLCSLIFNIYFIFIN